MFYTRLHALAHEQNSQELQRQTRALFQAVTSQMLNSQRFYGELLLRLDKRADTGLASAISLTTAKQPVLLINPVCLSEIIRSDQDLLSLIQHVVSHLAWQHPMRYAKQGADPLVQLATDMAVNDHLMSLYPGAITRQRVNFKLDLHLAANLGSSEYLAQLKDAIRQDQSGTKARQIKQILGQSPETHLGWQRLNNDSALQLNQMVAKSWQETPTKQRGLLPSKLQHRLNRRPATLTLDWRSLVMVGLNGPQKRQEPAFNRFNRRQPYRLELPGVTRTATRQLYLFVDQSGSMTDAEVQNILAQIVQLLKRYRDKITVIPFDASVHDEHLQAISHSSRILFQRVAGGGTAYQSIFDWLIKRGATDGSALVLILTDGHGEGVVNTHGLTNIIWGLTTTKADLSVKKPVGRLTVIRERK
ncbi:VWA domain-containing protein [Lactobacillus sp. LC28-10]|uniref:VWA domain-containing protein n=1 Tax=Secundilactobacillus angelensis TaxID=2722706 RepID=A0ABX1KY18_9LACO|nr:VWA-like domain-containing protein [Secundilactobacillus angelensis]MCH5461464.1 VWA-like domain-containing protein [Secundilactobacillus angelensis]NLR17723.1 VWA domain-containing protein [Secundilactobacillus angelensis]